MLVNFEKLPDASKIWIYQSNRNFYPEEILEITEKLETFLTTWKDNENEIYASYRIVYKRFIIIAIDKSNSAISVEAIDKSVRFILQLESDHSITLLDKINVCFKQGEYVQYKDLKDFKKLIKNKSVSAKTIVFNNLINTKDELEDNWEIPLSDSWHNRFL